MGRQKSKALWQSWFDLVCAILAWVAWAVAVWHPQDPGALRALAAAVVLRWLAEAGWAGDL